MDKQKIADRVSKSMTSAIDERTIGAIVRLTERNNHSGAIVMLAKVMKDGRLLKVAESIETLRDFAGYLPNGMREIQDKVRGVLLQKAKKKLSPEDYQSLYMAF